VIYHLILKPILHLLAAIIGEERIDRWSEASFVPFWFVVLPLVTVAVTIWALVIA